MNLILFGFKGCGKTHFGKRLAMKMKRPFIDTDDLVSELHAERTGNRLKANDLYREIGAANFRALESEAIATLEKVQNAVIALGGGAVLDPGNVEQLLKIGAMVYLEASPELLRKRILRDEIPSFLDENDPLASFHAMLLERKPIYESIPARKIKTDILDEAGVIAALCSILLLEEPPDGF